MSANARTVEEILEEARATFIERGQQYGKSYYQHGHIMHALFPDGISLRGIDDFNRFALLDLVVVKINRYVTHWHNPHCDSIHDLGVYSFMLEEVDEDYRQRQLKEVDEDYRQRQLKEVLEDDCPNHGG